jgi:large subunit ribosomal protein L18
MANKSLSPIKMRHKRIRKKVAGTSERPRLAVHFSGQHIYAQVIDDGAGVTLAAVNTTEKDFRADKNSRPNVTTATKVGKLVAERIKGKISAKSCSIAAALFYHGKVKALADAAARERPRILTYPYGSTPRKQ